MPTKTEVKRRLKKLYHGEWSIHTKHPEMGDVIRLNDEYVTIVSLANDSMDKIILSTFLGMRWMVNKPIKILCQLKKK